MSDKPKTMYAVMIQLLRQEKNGGNSISMSSTIFPTREDAQGYIDETRRQNLPMNGRWIIPFEDPRGEK